MWALQLFRRIVSQSLNNVDDGAESVLKKCSKPFSFEENKGNSEFEIVQILRDEEYQYGFEYNSEKIVMEWLYRKSLKTNRKVTIFERTMQKVNLGVYVRKKCEAYKDQIPPETLLLSFFNKLKLKTDIFKTVYSGITDVLVFMSDDYEDTRFLDALLPKVIDGKKEKLLEFLTAIDIGIKDITCNGVQREHNKKLNNGLPILHKVPPKRDYGRYFCIMAEKGGTSHGGLTEKLSPFFHAKKQEVNAYGR